jgi:putative membrane protein
MAANPAKMPTSNELAQQRTGMASGRTQMADDRTSLAFDRTRLAHERTLMAWVRTATSLISFGFTIYKFFQYLREDPQFVATHHRVLSPQHFAVAMISLGIGALLLATVEHRRQMRALQARYNKYGTMPGSPATTVAWVVSGLGLVALVLVAFGQ